MTKEIQIINVSGFSMYVATDGESFRFATEDKKALGYMIGCEIRNDLFAGNGRPLVMRMKSVTDSVLCDNQQLTLPLEVVQNVK